MMSAMPPDTSPTTGTPAPRDLRLAVVGVGQRSVIALHAPEVLPGTTLVATVDTTEEGRDRSRAWFGDIPALSSVTELVQRGDVDAAVVTTPDATHVAVASELLDAGIAVYLEKPLATTLEGADHLLEKAAATGTPLYVGHNFRHSGVAQTLRGVVERGEIGEVKAIWCRHFVGNGGDYYFKDWHADRAQVNSLLLQKASHDIDVIHYLANGYSRLVVGMGDLMVYGGVTDRSEHPGQTMTDWFSFDNWPPAAQTGLNAVVDVEDVSMMMMTLDNGVLASYQQCHFTPDYWRNYTVIGTEGRAENIGDTGSGVVKVWDRRHEWQVAGDREYPIDGVTSGHRDADVTTMAEFLHHVRDGAPVTLSPVAARESVAAGALAADSLRDGSRPRTVPPLPERLTSYFSRMTSTTPDLGRTTP